jgi:hypothetical protein
MTAPLSYNVEEAAAALGSSFTVDWLKARIRRNAIPFGKTGDGDGKSGRIYFTPRHLERILAMYSHEPDMAGDPTAQPVTRRRAS